MKKSKKAPAKTAASTNLQTQTAALPITDAYDGPISGELVRPTPLPLPAPSVPRNSRVLPSSHTHPVADTLRPQPIVRATVPSHEYEPLEGGRGKEVFYRQARFTISDLLGSHCDIEHSVRFATHSGVIIDFGINGVAFSTEAPALETDQVIDGFRVIIGADTMYEGRALVRYCRNDSSSKSAVGVVLLDGIIDTDAVVMAKNRSLAQKTAYLLSSTIKAGVCSKYKDAMADLTLLLSSYRQQLNSQEDSIVQLSTPLARSRAEHDVLRAAVADFGEQFDHYRRLCNDITFEIDTGLRVAYGRYTEAVIHPYVLSAPLPHHCYNKPLGYPGDFALMSYLYDPRPYGNSLYDKMIHQVVVREEPMAVGVQRRKDYLLQLIRSGLDRRQSHGQPFRVMSLACGPAQEVLEFVTEMREICPPTVFTLIDQDQRSLSFVNSCLARLLIPGSTDIKVNYMYLGFKNMIARSEAFDSLAQQDLIYAAGLFDYIRTPTGQRLVSRLVQKLRPGGKLAVGNFKAPNNTTWALEYWMDWHLIYRTVDDMLALAERVELDHKVELATDASGLTRVLLVRREA